MPIETPVNVLEKPEMHAVYKHYKGSRYVPFAMCRIEEGWVESVAYYNEKDPAIFIIRPLTLWNSHVRMSDGSSMRRFTKVVDRRVVEAPEGPDLLPAGTFSLSGSDALNFLKGLRGPDDSVSGLINVLKERKKSEEELRISNEKAKALAARDDLLALLAWLVAKGYDKHGVFYARIDELLQIAGLGKMMP